MTVTTARTEEIVTCLRGALDGRWAHVRERMREVTDADLFAPVHGLDVESHRALTLAQLQEVAGSGLPRLGFDPAYGGGGDLGGSVTAMESMSADLSLMIKVGVQFGLFGGAIQALGTERHHREHLEPLMDGELLGGFAMTETGHGSDVQRLRTTATYDPQTETFVVHTPHEAARKEYIGNAARDGRLMVVFAQLITKGEHHGVHALLVPIRAADGTPCAGVTIADCGHKAGLNGVDNGRLWFDQVRVPRQALLNRYADVAADGTYSSPISSDGARFFTQLGTLVKGRASVAGGALSATKVALTIAGRYAEVRRQFPVPDVDETPPPETTLLDYPAHQRRLLPALASTYALQFAQAELVSALHDHAEAPEDAHQRELEARAAGIKAVATWHATATIQMCREACGGAGYLSENQLPQLKADTDVFTTFEGDNTVLLQQVTKSLLTSYAEAVGDLGNIALARMAVDQIVGTALERTAAKALIAQLVSAAKRRGEEADLTDRGWQLAMFEEREEHVLEGLARRLRPNGHGRSSTARFNDAQDHVLFTARAHVDRVVLEAFVAAIDRCEDPDGAALLDRLCDLFALTTIEADRGWFLEHGRMSAARSKSITQAVNQLCARLREDAQTLIGGLGIPDRWVTAPIAVGDEARRQDEQAAHERGESEPPRAGLLVR